jgi:hypothetical protein
MQFWIKAIKFNRSAENIDDEEDDAESLKSDTDDARQVVDDDN